MALRALPRADGRVHGARPRDRLPRLALDPLPEHATRPPSASTCGAAWQVIERAHRRAMAARLVHRPRQPEHAPPGGRPRRLRVRQRLLRRRPAVLDAGARRPTARACRTWSCRTRSTRNDMRFALPQGFNTGDHFFSTCATASTCCTPKATSAPKMMSIGMHCRLLGKPGPHRARCSAFSTTSQQHDRVWVCRAHRHRAPLEGDASRSTARTALTMAPCTLTLDQLNARHAGRSSRALLDGIYEHSPWIAERARPRRGRSRSLRAPEARAGRGRARAPAATQQLALIRAHPELAGKAMVAQDAHRRVDPRAGQGRPDRLHARGVRAHPAAQRRLQREVRLPVHPRGARAARHGPGQARDHRHLRAPAATTIRTSSSPRRCATSTASPRSASTTSSASRPTLGNQVWDWAEQLARAQRPGLRRARPAHRHLPHRRAPRLRARSSSRWMREDCGFDEVTIDAVGNVVGVYHGADAATRSACSPARTTTPCATAASTTAGSASSCRWPACASCSAPAGACRSASRWSASPKRKASATRPPSSARAR